MPLFVGAIVRSVIAGVEYYRNRGTLERLTIEADLGVLHGLSAVERVHARQQLLAAEFAAKVGARDMTPARLGDLMCKVVTLMKQDIVEAESALRAEPANKHDIAVLAVSMQELTLSVMQDLKKEGLRVEARHAEMARRIDSVQVEMRTMGESHRKLREDFQAQSRWFERTQYRVAWAMAAALVLASVAVLLAILARSQG